MEWLEVSTTVEHEAAEVVAEILSRYAHRGVVIEAGPDGWKAGPVVVKAYLPADEQLQTNKRRIEEALWHVGQIRPVSAPTFRPIFETDWTEAWKRRLNILHVGRCIVIQPSWLDYVPAPGEVIIQLDPGMAFGTGLHPTTQMCLEALEELLYPGAEVLDLGTGSGILAIAAAKLGAGRVLAVDNDPTAVKAARENVLANQVQGIVRVAGGSLANVAGSYDTVVVNILARVIVEMVQQGLATHMHPDGVLIAAGIIADQEPEIIASLKQEKLAVMERLQRDEWVCLIARRGYSLG